MSDEVKDGRHLMINNSRWRPMHENAAERLRINAARWQELQQKFGGLAPDPELAGADGETSGE
jgi:hypothetical protein